VRALSLSPPPLRTRLEREGGHWLKKIKEGKRKFRSSPSHPAHIGKNKNQGKKDSSIKKGKWNLARPHHGPKKKKTAMSLRMVLHAALHHVKYMLD